MKRLHRQIAASLVYVLFLVSAWAAQGPSSSEIRDSITKDISAGVILSAFRVFETENLGASTDPQIHTRIEFKLTPSDQLYLSRGKLGDVTVVEPEDSGPVAVNAIAVSILVQGKWTTRLTKVEFDHEKQGHPGSSYGKYVIKGSPEHLALQQRIEKDLRDTRGKFSGVWGWPAPYTRNDKPLLVPATGGCIYIRIAIPEDGRMAGYATVGFYDEYTSMPYIEHSMPYSYTDKGFFLVNTNTAADFTKVNLPFSHSDWKLSVSPEGKLIVHGEEFYASLIHYDIATAKTGRYGRQMAARKLLTGVWKAREGISYEGNQYIKRDAAAIRMGFVIKDGVDWTGDVEVVLDSARGKIVNSGTFRIMDDEIVIAEGKRGPIGRWPKNIKWHITFEGAQMIARAGQAKVVLYR